MTLEHKDLRNLNVCSRRNLWRAIVQEVIIARKTFRGGKAFRLCDLADWPDEQLASLRPAVSKQFEICLDDGQVCARHRGTGKMECLFPMDKAPLMVFNQFNGDNDLEKISKGLAQELGWDENQAFVYTKDLFLDLIARLVCIPANDPVVGV